MWYTVCVELPLYVIATVETLLITSYSAICVHLQVPVKERAGHFVMTYHMDVRTEPVETIQLQPAKYGVLRQGERLDLHELAVQEKNGRVLAGAWR